MITRIEQLKKFYGLTTRGLAIKCGLNQPTLDRMLKGVNALNLNCVSSILTAFPDVSSEWLMRGTGEMLIKNQPNSEEVERINKQDDIITILMDTIKANNKTIATLTERIKQLENK